MGSPPKLGIASEGTFQVQLGGQSAHVVEFVTFVTLSTIERQTDEQFVEFASFVMLSRMERQTEAFRQPRGHGTLARLLDTDVTFSGRGLPVTEPTRPVTVISMFAGNGSEDFTMIVIVF